MHTFTKVGLDALLTPENSAALLIDHQPSQLANVNSHEPTMVINNVTALAGGASYGPTRVPFAWSLDTVAGRMIPLR
jgi:nicotinamidase-related amidase